ncbi:sigma-54 interaction domain-containing protein [Chitiniphilus eburneus]|uniref:Sigma-54-dependent Fis family transcriptional regulator n=1 Tax=Chitiniphilus eburneus TaxID=2571148 RepID=A0A4U0Q2X4_9NEIS|nr:sigma-54 dependent transcriptional regulator [Chitiniphilus eburneus]TJZ70054.1 sigma-54-dependent Fis family transcriptional regulator [Chitiniphilus eburneus]
MFDSHYDYASDARRDNVVAMPMRGAVPREPSELTRFGMMYGASPAMREVFAMVERVAPTEAAVLVVGESGCGKELVAQTVHQLSARADAPFVAVNCGALPGSLIEAELFGYEKGAFTGANRTHPGVFERAEGGTLFLDEITEMPLDMQVRLLRVLETRCFTRVGGEREMRCNVRVVAATNRDPHQAVAEGALREDLLYRLAVFPIALPPLRERAADVLLLARHFLGELNREHGTQKKLTEASEAAILRHAWPGNVRELKNCLQRAYIMSENWVEVDPENAMPGMGSRPATRPGMLEFEVGTSLPDMERRMIIATLDKFAGNKRKTAEVLGVSLKTLYNRLNEYARREARYATA